MKSALFLLIALCHALILPGSASAHPHVWVQVTSQIVYDSEGKAAAVRHAWKFDDMYSAFAVE